MDTVETIPHLVPIPNTTIKSVLRSTADKLVTCLDSMPQIFKPPHTSTQQALKDIAALLHRDLQVKRERLSKQLEAKVITSEGDKVTSLTKIK